VGKFATVSTACAFGEAVSVGDTGVCVTLSVSATIGIGGAFLGTDFGSKSAWVNTGIPCACAFVLLLAKGTKISGFPTVSIFGAEGEWCVGFAVFIGLASGEAGAFVEAVVDVTEESAAARVLALAGSHTNLDVNSAGVLALCAGLAVGSSGTDFSEFDFAGCGVGCCVVVGLFGVVGCFGLVGCFGIVWGGAVGLGGIFDTFSIGTDFVADTVSGAFALCFGSRAGLEGTCTDQQHK
jgi:hypothetical protein